MLTQLRAHDEKQRAEALRQLQALDREPIIIVLAAKLAEVDAEEQGYIAEALLLIDPLQGVPLVLPLLESSESTLRWYISGLLSNYPHKEAVMPLAHLLLTDPEGDVRLNAAFTLGRIGDPRALSALEQAQRHDKGTDYEGRPISEEAAEAIAAILAKQ